MPEQMWRLRRHPATWLWHLDQCWVHQDIHLEGSSWHPTSGSGHTRRNLGNLSASWQRTLQYWWTSCGKNQASLASQTRCAVVFELCPPRLVACRQTWKGWQYCCQVAPSSVHHTRSAPRCIHQLTLGACPMWLRRQWMSLSLPLSF